MTPQPLPNCLLGILPALFHACKPHKSAWLILLLLLTIPIDNIMLSTTVPIGSTSFKNLVAGAQENSTNLIEDILVNIIMSFFEYF